jgi:hypothetical protein
MAQLNESTLIVRISKLLRDDEPMNELVDADTVTNLEAVLEELIGDPKALIEIIKTDE